MLRNGLFPRYGKLPLAVVVGAMIALTAAATSPAHAQAGEGFAIEIENDQPATWPAFSHALDEPCPPPPLNSPGWTHNSILTATTVVSAPLPQAVATGLFMLGGNWVVTRLWKKRKI